MENCLLKENISMIKKVGEWKTYDTGGDLIKTMKFKKIE